MSSRFVAAGGAEAPTLAENDDWARARKQVEETKKPDVDASGAQEGGKSLYEHLQAQKAAKQEAFEEATKLRNQFRPLDDSEVEFLESVKQNERAQAASTRRETAEQLDAFRQEQAAAEQLAREEASKRAEDPTQSKNDETTWTTAKKRRRIQDHNKGAVTKVKRTSAVENGPKEPAGQLGAAGSQQQTTPTETSKSVVSNVKPPSAVENAIRTLKPATALIAYDSDSDE